MLFLNNDRIKYTIGMVGKGYIEKLFTGLIDILYYLYYRGRLLFK